MRSKKGFTPLEIKTPDQESGRFPERHREGPRFAGSQTDIRQKHRSFLTGINATTSQRVSLTGNNPVYAVQNVIADDDSVMVEGVIGSAFP